MLREQFSITRSALALATSDSAVDLLRFTAAVGARRRPTGNRSCATVCARRSCRTLQCAWDEGKRARRSRDRIELFIPLPNRQARLVRRPDEECRMLAIG